MSKIVDIWNGLKTNLLSKYVVSYWQRGREKKNETISSVVQRLSTYEEATGCLVAQRRSSSPVVNRGPLRDRNVRNAVDGRCWASRKAWTASPHSVKKRNRCKPGWGQILSGHRSNGNSKKSGPGRGPCRSHAIQHLSLDPTDSIYLYKPI